MKNEAMLISAKYDICVPLMILVVSLAVILNTQDPWLIYIGLASIICCVAYCQIYARFLVLATKNGCGKRANLLINITDIIEALMLFMFICEIITFGYTYGV